jgi:hypothetical protein
VNTPDEKDLKRGLDAIRQRLWQRILLQANGDEELAARMMLEFCAAELVKEMETQGAEAVVERTNRYWRKHDIQLQLTYENGRVSLSRTS